MTPRDDFADELKKARAAAGLSQAELGARAGLTGSYICVLESRRKPPPSPDLVAALAKALSMDAAHLQELAALERTPEPVKQRVLRLVRERGRARRSRDTLLATTLFHMTRRPGFLPDLVADALGLPDDRRLILGKIAGRVRDVPTLAEAESRAGDLLDEVPGRERDALVRMLPGMLAGAAAELAPLPLPALDPQRPPDERTWRHVPVVSVPPISEGPPPSKDVLDTMHIDRRLYRPHCFLWKVDDDAAYPRVEKGDLLLVHPRGKPAEGGLVVVRDAGRAHVRVYRRAGDEVRLESARAEVPPIRVPADRFHPVGVVAWILKPLLGLPEPRRRERSDDAPPAG